MRKNVVLTVILSLVYSITIQSQQKLTMPKANMVAFNKQTRSLDGNPGANYWQNRVSYSIKATVDTRRKILHGSERIVYSNNSPDTLKKIVIRLYQDLFKKGANRNSLVDIDPRDITDGMSIDRIAVNNSPIATDPKQKQIQRNGTLMYLPLRDKLQPHGKSEIEIDWTFHIPEHSLIRMGAIDSTTIFLGQWYPQMAVYDDLNGWDTHSYNGLAEFYNEIADFTVDITVPQGFMVWATGEPVNLQQLLQPRYYSKYKKATTSDGITNLITPESLKKGDFTTTQHTWKYQASQVTDFAFGISDHYCWDITSVEVDKSTKRRTIVGVAYNPASKHFDKVVDIARKTILSASQEMPGIPFPFPYMTVFNGDFGVEYPMITNVGTESEYDMTVYANSHEIMHSYFPFYVCTNETKNGWMDEGMTVFLPEKAQTEISTLDEAKRNNAAFSKYAGMEDEPAMITSTHYLDQRIYFYLNYAKAEVALRMLQSELGDSLFRYCLTTLMERWKYKHPTPYDFFNTFNTLSKQDLNWFWNAWYFQNGGIPDLAIGQVTRTEGKTQVCVINKGDLPLPVVLSFFSNDKLVKSITLPASRWLSQPDKRMTVTLDTGEQITKITLGNDYIPDANQSDNIY
jgi:hypothetical protein